MDDYLTSSSLLMTSRCRLTAKGRLHMDPARTGSHVPQPARLQLNITARFVIERCDGTHSVTDIAKKLAQTWQMPEERAARDVLAFLEAMQQQGMVHAEGNEPAR